MLYYVKWKGWSDVHNTFEPIENLTKCNYLLMKHFETIAPSQETLKEKEKVVEQAVLKSPFYEKLESKTFGKEELEEFGKESPDLRALFSTPGDLDDLEKSLRQEFTFIIRCLVSMYYHEDPGLFLRAVNYRKCLELVKRRRRQLSELAAAERLINSAERGLLKVENNVDLDGFPTVEYIAANKLGEGVEMPPDAVVGCVCPGGCTPRSECCGKMADSQFAYAAGGKLRLPRRIPIYECNSRCACPPDCPNRVVQRGTRVRVCIFKTAVYGWGLKTLEKIPKGTFVCEYVGELIPDSQAVARDVEYAKSRTAYMFNLDFCTPNDHKDLYCIDATKRGNMARFINHSCEPNLIVYPIWVDCLDANLHRLAFFSKKNIRENEELTFDYENVQNVTYRNGKEGKRREKGKTRKPRVTTRVRCQCKSSNCREWLFGAK